MANAEWIDRMNLWPVYTVAGGVALALGFSVSWTAGDFSRIDPVRVEVRSIEYVEEDGAGFVRQHIVPSTEIRMAWTAQIVRGRRELCSGSGEAPYDGSTTEWLLDDWTGDDCPDTLLPTDQLNAAWEYRDESGFLHTIFAEFKAGE